MSLDRKSLPDREYNKFVESPSRPGEPAIEIVGNLVSTPGPFSPPANSDHVSISVTGGGFIVEYAFKVGGISGTVLKTVALEYATVQSPDLLEVSLV
jgi:hypothetical protein